jgi:hypothetical protein
MKTLNNQTLLYDEDCPMCTFIQPLLSKQKCLTTMVENHFVTLTVKLCDMIEPKRNRIS